MHSEQRGSSEPLINSHCGEISIFPLNIFSKNILFSFGSSILCTAGFPKNCFVPSTAWSLTKWNS